MLKGRDEVRCGEGAVVEGVEADRMSKIRRVQIDDTVGVRRGDSVGNSRRVITMRIEQGKALTPFQVGQHEIVEKRGLPGSGLADHVQMPASILVREQRRLAGGEVPEMHMLDIHGSPSEPIASLALRAALSWHCLCVERPSRGRAAAAERGRLISLFQIVSATGRCELLISDPRATA